MIQARPWRLRSGIRPSTGDPDLLETLLQVRGFSAEEKGKFLYPSLNHLPDGTDLLNLESSAVRVADALDATLIGICGDYDADGVCGTALLVRGLRMMGGTTCWLVPDRFTEGYGLAPLHVRRMHAQGAGLLITVDNGIRSLEAVAEARKRGLDLIITDHHIEGSEHPDSPWVINPNQPGDTSQLNDLCGTAVAFYLLTAVRRELRRRNHPGGSVSLAGLLDMVALATVADMMPLTGANRILVHAGLQQMRIQPSLWVRSLARVADLSPENINSQALGFSLGPRINAAGRLGSAGIGVQLMLAEEESYARQLADKLESLNRERRSIEELVVQEATLISAQTAVAGPLVAISSAWNQGVLGIAAAKLMHRRQAPVLLCTEKEGQFIGSARSVPGFNIHTVLAELTDRYTRFGGHAGAAGLTAPIEVLPPVRDLLNRRFAEAYPQGYREPLEIDTILANSPDLNTLAIQEQLQPFGRGNEAPVYALMGSKVKSCYLMKGKHLKVHLNQGNLACVGWNMAERYPLPGQGVHFAGTLHLNQYEGRSEVQFEILDIAMGDPFAL